MRDKAMNDTNGEKDEQLNSQKHRQHRRGNKSKLRMYIKC